MVTVTAFGTLTLVTGLSRLRDLLPGERSSVLLLGLLLIAYSSVALVFSEVISTRRLAVSGSSHLRLFRSLDLPIQHVVLRFGLIPCLRRIIPVGYLSLIFLLVFMEASDVYFFVLTLAGTAILLSGSIAVFAILYFASSPPQRTRLGGSTIILALLSGYILGSITSAAVPVLTSREGNAMDTWNLLGTVIVSAAAVTIALLSIGSLKLWRDLGYSPILVSKATPGSNRRPTTSMIVILISDLLNSKQGSVVVTSLTMWIAFLGALIGASNLLPVQLGLPAGQGARYEMGLAIVLSLGLIEPALQRVGPTVKLYHFRFLWENGAGFLSTILAPLIVYGASGLLVGGFISVAAFLVFGDWSPIAVLSGLITSLSAVLAEALSRPPLTTDGTKAADITDAFLTLVLIGPCAVILALEPQASTFWLVAYSLLTMTGAAVCLHFRQMNLQSSSIQ